MFLRCAPILALATFLTVLAALVFRASAQPTRTEYVLGGKTVSKDALETYMKGRQYLHDNDNADAILFLRKAAEMMPDNYEVRNNLGIALAKSGQVDEAIKELERALSLNPAIDASWITLGGVYQSAGRLDQAIETFSGFLSRFPANKDAKKVAALVAGLDSERNRLASERKERAPTRKEDDYLFEVTREGIIRWSNSQMPLRVFIQAGDSTPGYKKQYLDLLRGSFDSWAQASSGHVAFKFVDEESQADIVCQWCADPTRFKNIAESGHTVLDASRTGLVRGTITILTTPLVETLPVTDNRMRSTCLHEIGHVLGLAGHTSNPFDAMFHTLGVADTWRELTRRDSNTIIRLYSDGVADSRTP